MWGQSWTISTAEDRGWDSFLVEGSVQYLMDHCRDVTPSALAGLGLVGNDSIPD